MTPIEFRFGQILQREDICDRKSEIDTLTEIYKSCGRAVVYGPRRFGKTSVLKNVVLEDFIKQAKSTLGIYIDLFQLDSLEDFAARMKHSLEKAFSEKSRIKGFFMNLARYLRGLNLSFGVDSITMTPTVSVSSGSSKAIPLFEDLFVTLQNLCSEYKLLIILDEFQDVRFVKGLEGKLRSHLQELNRASIILSGSHAHILKDFFYDEKRPFYSFGTDIVFREIERRYWLPYMKKRFAAYDIRFRAHDEMSVVDEICSIMRDVPSAIQELCHWICISGTHGILTIKIVREKLTSLLDNKSSKLIEHIASFSRKERNVLFAIASCEPVNAPSSVDFLKCAGISATATRAAIQRFLDRGVISYTEKGYVLTDPLFRFLLLEHKR